jgi:hypothetical protein
MQGIKIEKEKEEKKRKGGGTLCNNGRGAFLCDFFFHNSVQPLNSRDLSMFGFNS